MKIYFGSLFSDSSALAYVFVFLSHVKFKMSKHFEHVKEQLAKIAAYQLSSKFIAAQRQFEELKNKIDDSIGSNKRGLISIKIFTV